MRERTLPVRVALGVSISMHLALLLPALVAVISTGANAHRMSSRLEPNDIARPASEDVELRIDLGIDAPTPPSLTWIGFDEYQEHLARLAEVDQAAFAENPMVEGSPEPSSAAPAATLPPVEPVDESLMHTEIFEGESVETTAMVVDDEDTSMSSFGASSTVAFDAMSLLAMLNSTAGEPGMQPDENEPRAPARLEPQLAAGDAPANDSPGEAVQPMNEPVRQTPGEAKTDPGAKANKESDPFSKIEVSIEDVKLGKPIAREGIEIFPRRPEFTLVTLLTAVPKNPLVEIRFQPNGRPSYAHILSSSGDDRVDSAIVSSLYRWRAEGKALGEVRESETLDVHIRIILNPYARDDDAKPRSDP